MSDADYRLVPMTAGYARDILSWRYPSPYDFYDPPEEGPMDQFVREFLNPELQFHVVLNGSLFVGFCSFGIDGQVPGGDYSSDALDVGLGMRPELTGKGLGTAFVDSILRFAGESMNPDRYRMTVADFNVRAMRLYKSLGFVEDSVFQDARNQVPYTILVRDA